MLPADAVVVVWRPDRSTGLGKGNLRWCKSGVSTPNRGAAMEYPVHSMMMRARSVVIVAVQRMQWWIFA